MFQRFLVCKAYLSRWLITQRCIARALTWSIADVECKNAVSQTAASASCGNCNFAHISCVHINKEASEHHKRAIESLLDFDTEHCSSISTPGQPKPKPKPKYYADAVRAFMPEYFKDVMRYADDGVASAGTLTGDRWKHLKQAFDKLGPQEKAYYQKLAEDSKAIRKLAGVMVDPSMQEPAAAVKSPGPEVLPLNAMRSTHNIVSLDMHDAESHLISSVQETVSEVRDACLVGTPLCAVTSAEVHDTLQSFKARGLTIAEATQKFRDTCGQLGARPDPADKFSGARLSNPFGMNV